MEPVLSPPTLSRLLMVETGKELVEMLHGTLEHHQTAIVGSVWGEVDDALHAVHKLSSRRSDQEESRGSNDMIAEEG